MNKFVNPSLLLAGLIALAGVAQAQSAAGTSDVPVKAGEVSTMTEGVPNAKTTNTPGSEAPALTRSEIREDAQGRNKPTATNRTPGRAGEASTMVNGRPNGNPDAPTLSKSRSEIRTEKEFKKAQRRQEREIAVMGQKGSQGGEVGTPHMPTAGDRAAPK